VIQVTHLNKFKLHFTFKKDTNNIYFIFLAELPKRVGQMMRRIRRCRSLRPWCRTCHDRMDYTMERMEKLIVICLLYITHQTAKKKDVNHSFVV
jgi:hypothetical protein